MPFPELLEGLISQQKTWYVLSKQVLNFFNIIASLVSLGPCFQFIHDDTTLAEVRLNFFGSLFMAGSYH
jgi:hypothetical protein